MKKRKRKMFARFSKFFRFGKKIQMEWKGFLYNLKKLLIQNKKK